MRRSHDAAPHGVIFWTLVGLLFMRTPSFPLVQVSLRSLAVVLLSSTLFGTTYAAPLSAGEAAAAMEIAKNNGCLSCHATSEKIVGPAYSKIAEKYRDDKDAVATLMQSIQYGSKGKWGRIPMPANGSVSNDDLKTLARWVMSIDK